MAELPLDEVSFAPITELRALLDRRAVSSRAASVSRSGAASAISPTALSNRRAAPAVSERARARKAPPTAGAFAAFVRLSSASAVTASCPGASMLRNATRAAARSPSKRASHPAT